MTSLRRAAPVHGAVNDSGFLGSAGDTHNSVATALAYASGGLPPRVKRLA